MKRGVILWGLASAIMASIASIIWDRVYFFAMQTDFTQIINPLSIIGATFLGCILAVVCYSILEKFFKKNHEIIFNFGLSIFTIASLIAPLSITLPLDISFPELFPALTIPMHFFPALALYTLRPLFKL